MKKLLAVSAVAAFALLAGCGSSNRVEAESSTTTVKAKTCSGEKACSEGKTCSKGEACCSNAKTCSDKANMN